MQNNGQPIRNDSSNWIKKKTSNSNITEFFQSNINLPVRTVGTLIQITKNESDPLTTITHKNNTHNLSKDSNSSNSDSKYDRLSKQME